MNIHTLKASDFSGYEATILKALKESKSGDYFTLPIYYPMVPGDEKKEVDAFCEKYGVHIISEWTELDGRYHFMRTRKVLKDPKKTILKAAGYGRTISQIKNRIRSNWAHNEIFENAFNELVDSGSLKMVYERGRRVPRYKAL